MGLLDEALGHYLSTIDEYSLAHYFANLLMDDFIVLYVKAAAEQKLKVYDNGSIVLSDTEIEPTCISDLDDERYKAPLWVMKKLLEEHLKKERFWEIDESTLLQLSTCIGELWLAKIMILAGYNDDASHT